MAKDSEQKTLQDLFRVVNEIRAEIRTNFDQVRGELRDAKRTLGQDIDGVNASLTALKATVDGHTARFRDMSARFDDLSDKLRRIEERLDHAHIPAE
jgi:rubrerythrin